MLLKNKIFLGSLLFLLCFGFSIHSGAQILQEHYDSRIKPYDTSGILSLSLNSSTFFNNKEFFGVEEEGYTLTGGYLQPLLMYNLSNKLNIGAGIHLLKYFGRDEMLQALPMLRIEYHPAENFSLIMGSFNGGESFRMPYPLYRFEKQFTSLINNGVLLNHHSEHFKSQLWLDWEQLILPNDTFQEMFTAGNSTRIFLFANENFRIALPVWFVIHHEGGQINFSNKPVVTKTDLGTGLEVSRFYNNGFIEELSIGSRLFFDIDEKDGENGIAIQPRMILKGKFLETEFGMFYGDKYQSYWGNPLLFSRPFIPDTEESFERLDLLFRAGYVKKLSENSSLVLRFESWYDTQINKFQYSYGLQIMINEQFILKNFLK